MTPLFRFSGCHVITVTVITLSWRSSSVSFTCQAAIEGHFRETEKPLSHHLHCGLSCIPHNQTGVFTPAVVTCDDTHMTFDSLRRSERMTVGSHAGAKIQMDQHRSVPLGYTGTARNHNTPARASYILACFHRP